MVKLNSDELNQLGQRRVIIAGSNELLLNELNSYLIYLGQKYNIIGKFEIDKEGNIMQLTEEDKVKTDGADN